MDQQFIPSITPAADPSATPNSALSGLATGLRGIAGVYSPGVFQHQLGQEDIQMQADIHKKQALAGVVVNAVEKGALDPERGKSILQQIGYGDLAVGPSAQTTQTGIENQAKTRDLDLNAAADQEQKDTWQRYMTSIESSDPGVSKKIENVDPTTGSPQITIESNNETLKAVKAVNQQLSQSPNPVLAKRGLDALLEIHKIEKEQQDRDTQPERQMQNMIAAQLAADKASGMSDADLAIRKQQLNTETSRALLERKTPVVDPTTGRLYMGQALEVPGSITVGRTPGAPPVNQLPSLGGPDNRKSPGEGEMKVLSEGDALRGVLADMRTLYSPDYVGPIKGRVGTLAGATVGNPQDRAEFLAKLNTYRNRTIKFITGAQMSEVETSRLKQEIPGENDPPETFAAKLKSSEDNINYVLKAYQQNLQMTGHSTAGGNPVSPNQPQVKAAPTVSIRGQKLARPEAEAKIDARGKELEAQFRQKFPEWDDDHIKQLVMRYLQAEFPLDQ